MTPEVNTINTFKWEKFNKEFVRPPRPKYLARVSVFFLRQKHLNQESNRATMLHVCRVCLLPVSEYLFVPLNVIESLLYLRAFPALVFQKPTGINVVDIA